MTNEATPQRELLEGLEELAGRLHAMDDRWDSDDDLEVLVPALARRIIAVTHPTNGERNDCMILMMDYLRCFVQDPDLLPPLDHEEEL